MAIATDNYIVLKDGKFDTINGAGTPGMDREFQSLATAKPARVVIYFHGGLVSLQTGEGQANTLNPLFINAQSSPMFLVWETGITEVIEQRLPAIFNEAIFQRILRRVTQFVKGKVDKETMAGTPKATDPLPLTREDQIQAQIQSAQATLQMPIDSRIHQLDPDTTLTPSERAQIEQEIVGDIQLQTQAQQVANTRQPAGKAEINARAAVVQGSTATLMDQDVLEDIAPAAPGAKGVLSMVQLAIHIVKVVARIIERFAKHRDHGAYLTIIEEIFREFYVGNAGKFIWAGIKKEVDDAFGVAADCGGTQLVAHLNALWTGGVKPRVTLIGHSAGAIYVARLLKELHAKMPPDFQCEVVFIAPAVIFHVFADAIQNAGSRIARLRIVGMGDPLELKNAIAGPVYPASLLYFVSGVLEEHSDEPILGMQRYYAAPYVGAGFEDIAFVKAFTPLTLAKAFAWADITQGDGANCDMHSHGGWITAAPATLASVLKIVEYGV